MQITYRAAEAAAPAISVGVLAAGLAAPLLGGGAVRLVVEHPAGTAGIAYGMELCVRRNSLLRGLPPAVRGMAAAAAIRRGSFAADR